MLIVLRKKFRFIKLLTVLNLLFLSCIKVSYANELDDAVAAHDQALGKVVKQARAKLIEGKAEEAYQLLLPHEALGAGIIGYDFLLGTAALDSGHISESIMILQRTLDVEPDLSGARLELARAFFEQGDNEQARHHFNLLKQQSMPPRVAKVVDQYLTAIERKSSKYQSKFIPSVSFNLGYDSNVNAATEDELFLGFFLNENNIAQESEFVQLELSSLYSKPVSPDTLFFVDAKLSHRANPQASFVDLTGLNISSGFRWDMKNSDFGLKLGGRNQQVDGGFNRETVYLQGSFLYQVSDKFKLNTLLTNNQNRYQDNVEIRDVDQILTSVGFQYFADNKNDSIGLFYLLGEDDALIKSSAYSNERKGVQLTAQKVFSADLLLTGVALVNQVDYVGETLFFGVTREDKQKILALSLHWFNLTESNWRLSTSLSYIDNQSNVPLYDFERAELSLTMQKQFD